MMRVALKFAKEINNGADPLVAYSRVVGSPRHISMNTLGKLRQYAQKKGMRLGKQAMITRSGSDGGLAVFSNKDKKNVLQILSTLNFLDRAKFFKDKKGGPGSILHKFFDKNEEGQIYNIFNNTYIKSSPYDRAYNLIHQSFKDKNGNYARVNHDKSDMIDFVMINSPDKFTVGHELGHAALGDYGKSNWVEPDPITKDLKPAELSQELQADHIGAWISAGMKDHVSDSRAIKIAQGVYNHFNKDMSFSNKRNYDKYEKSIVERTLKVIDDTIPQFEEMLKSAKNNKERRYYQKMLSKFKKDKETFLKTKPVRYVKGVPVYPGRITRLIYGLYASGIGVLHPHNLVRANYILHNLRPDLFDETGRNIKTGEYVDFTLKGQIVRTLKRAKTVGKRQYKVTVGRLKRALGKFGNAVKEKISGWIPTQAQPAAVSESYYYNFLNLNKRSVIFP